MNVALKLDNLVLKAGSDLPAVQCWAIFLTNLCLISLSIKEEIAVISLHTIIFHFKHYWKCLLMELGVPRAISDDDKGGCVRQGLESRTLACATSLCYLPVSRRNSSKDKNEVRHKK